MTISTQSFQSLVQNAVSAMQGAASALVDLTVGSVLRALVDTYCGLALWLQGIALQVASLTRFATSYGTDADSWGADYGFERLKAVASSGAVTLARFTPTAAATIQAATSSGVGANGQNIWTGGAVVQTQDGTQQFQVIPDTNQAAYNSTLNVYVINAAVTSAAVTVQNNVAGSAGNVVGGGINTLGSAIPGVDTVTNALAFDNGADDERDPEFKARFPEFIESLNEGTPTAVENAVTNLQEGATCFLVENYTLSGVYQAGYFYCVVDDGSGSPPSGFLTSAYNAIDKVRAIDTIFNVYAPTVVAANVVGVIEIAAGYDLTTLENLAQAAVIAYIDALKTGATLSVGRLYQIIFDASPGITLVVYGSVTINGVAADLVMTGTQLAKAGTVSIT